jgi:hypothetical protein
MAERWAAVDPLCLRGLGCPVTSVAVSHAMSRLFLKAKIKRQPSTAQYGLVPKTFARQRKMWGRQIGGQAAKVKIVVKCFCHDFFRHN